MMNNCSFGKRLKQRNCSVKVASCRSWLFLLHQKLLNYFDCNHVEEKEETNQKETKELRTVSARARSKQLELDRQALDEFVSISDDWITRNNDANQHGGVPRSPSTNERKVLHVNAINAILSKIGNGTSCMVSVVNLADVDWWYEADDKPLHERSTRKQ